MVSLKEKLCLSNIMRALKLKSIDDYTLFKYYVKGFTAIGKSFKDRIEKRSSSNTKLTLDGRILFNDFGEGSKAINIFQYIMKNEGYPDNYQGFLAALDKVRQDFSLDTIEPYNGKLNIIKSNKIPVIFNKLDFKSNFKEIQVKRRNYTQEDLDFWNKFTFNSVITEKDLRYFKIYPLDHYWVNGWQFSCQTLTYLYLIGDKIKLYFPFQEEYRFIGNTNKDSIQGYNQLPKNGDLLVITKSLKDIICLKKELGISAVAPNSENMFLTKEKLSELKQRFKKIIIYYDNDWTGIEFSIKFSKEFDLEYIINPLESEYKDYSDVLKSKHISLIKQINKYFYEY